ncbi:thioredoxin-domain-containing protein [Parathielavia hyrcaniae]|uniref:protein disulfide-isomerase n=1 Tax=Parathielavia hyrcaniae TaxID=113614 RepID=A0AAN6SZP2_9PEZI|nr:thioredoxin-domain-containing protein [Parathielavia hyrcaniae]
MHHTTLCAVAAALLSALPGAQASMYAKKSPVLQVDAKNYDRLIAKSNYTSIVEFYAPWCGHCKNLKPAYEKAAKNLEGLAKVAAVNCDDDANKSFCGSMGVQGFPTLKIVRPKKGGGKPMVQDYQGQRTASAIVEAVVQQINNYVIKVEDKSLDKFLADKETPKAILFTEKGTTSTLLKSIAIDFAGVVTIGQARNKETKAVETFCVNKFPTLLLLPGGDASAVVYDGEMKKDAIVQFLSQAGQPNPESPAKGDGKAKEKKSGNASSAKAKPKTTSSKTFSATPVSETETATQEAPVIVETALPIPSINTPDKLVKECFTEKSHTCVLAFVSSTESEKRKKALESLSELAFKHAQSKRHLFPFYEVPMGNEGVASILKALDLTGDVEIVAVNSRRGWWRHYDGADFGHESVESWIDAIRLSEGVKKKLPEGIVAIAVEEPTSAAAPEASSEPTPDATEAGVSEEATQVTPEASGEAASDSTESTSTQATDPTGEPETAHDEL